MLATPIPVHNIPHYKAYLPAATTAFKLVVSYLHGPLLPSLVSLFLLVLCSTQGWSRTNGSALSVRFPAGCQRRGKPFVPLAGCSGGLIEVDVKSAAGRRGIRYTHGGCGTTRSSRSSTLPG